MNVPLRNVSIVDIVWGLGFVLVAWVSFFLAATSGPSRWLLAVLTTIWGVRLSLHLAIRNIGKGEDKRYVAMRERAGSSFAYRSLLTVFGLQGLIMWVVSLPVQAGIGLSEPGWTWLHAAGLVLWVGGFCFEGIGDLQLARFKSDPSNAGKVMKTGLWRYTRHPNYFGDALLWWGYWVIAIGGGAAWSVYGPVIMTWLLLKVSGVTLLERGLERSRPGYAEYVARTSAFIPWPPKR